MFAWDNCPRLLRKRGVILNSFLSVRHKNFNKGRVPLARMFKIDTGAVMERYDLILLNNIKNLISVSVFKYKEHMRTALVRNIWFSTLKKEKEIVFLKSAWRYSVIGYYDKTRNTPYFAPWQLRDVRIGVYRWTQCKYKMRFYKSHSRFSKITTGYRCRNIWTMQTWQIAIS